MVGYLQGNHTEMLVAEVNVGTILHSK